MNVSDVKVWDAPSIGRNDGMSVETKCYQHVVIWADYAKALMKVEDERDEANRVCEQWRQWTVATRADNEALRARVAELEAALRAVAARLDQPVFRGDEKAGSAATARILRADIRSALVVAISAIDAARNAPIAGIGLPANKDEVRK